MSNDAPLTRNGGLTFVQERGYQSTLAIFVYLNLPHLLMQVCDEFNGWTRFKTHQPFGAPKPLWMSVPRSHAAHPSDTYPDASERTIKKAIVNAHVALQH